MQKRYDIEYINGNRSIVEVTKDLQGRIDKFLGTNNIATKFTR
jgi:hypothetical protein